METAPRTDTSHEARARNAKAQALAAVLYEHAAEVADLSTEQFALSSIAWSLAAQVATMKGYMGEGRFVHPPNSQATIDAVARILGDLIAHEADQNAIAEQVAPVDVMTADLDADDPEPWCDDDDRAEAIEIELTEQGARKVAEHFARRRPTDSAGYRRTVRELDPTTAAAFSAFGQAAGR